MEEEKNEYLDGEDTRPKKIFFTIVGIIVGLILITVVSCSIINSNKMDDNNNLSSLLINGDKIELSDSLKYNYNTINESVSLKCTSVSKNAKIKNCDSNIDLILNKCTERKITVISESKKEKVYTINICRYDSELPSILEITSNPKEYTSGDVEVVVSLDPNAFFEEGMYSFDGGLSWQKENSIKIKENTTLGIVIKNKYGTKSNEQKYEVKNIDKVEPIVLLNSNVVSGTSTYKSIKLTSAVTPSTTVSGYKYEWYLNDKLIPDSNKSEYTATSSGTYKVKVITGAGKEATSESYKAVIAKEPTAKIVFSDSNVKSGSTITKSVTLNAKVENGTVNKIVWYENGKSVSGSSSYTVGVSKTGKFEYKFQATLTDGYTVTSPAVTLNVKNSSQQPQPKPTSTVTLSLEAHLGSATGSVYKSGWTNKNVYIVATATSNGSEIKNISFDGYKSFDTNKSATYSFTKTINKEITVTATDKLGTKASKKITVKIDKVAPYTPSLSDTSVLKDYVCYKEGSSTPVTNKNNLSYDLLCTALVKTTKYSLKTNDVDTGGSGINYCEIVYAEDENEIYGYIGDFVWDFNDNKQYNKNTIKWYKDNNYNISLNPRNLTYAALYSRRCYDKAGNVGTALFYLFTGD